MFLGTALHVMDKPCNFCYPHAVKPCELWSCGPDSCPPGGAYLNYRWGPAHGKTRQRTLGVPEGHLGHRPTHGSRAASHGLAPPFALPLRNSLCLLTPPLPQPCVPLCSFLSSKRESEFGERNKQNLCTLASAGPGPSSLKISQMVNRKSTHTHVHIREIPTRSRHPSLSFSLTLKGESHQTPRHPFPLTCLMWPLPQDDPRSQPECPASTE